MRGLTLMASLWVVGAASPAWAVDCAAGSTQCGVLHCTDNTKICCASAGHEELSCPMGTACQTDGSCKSTGMPGSCTGGGVNTLDTCGGDSCGCSAPCKSGQDCESKCCTTAGYCARACVCNGAGKLFLECNLGGNGFEGQSKSCSFLPGRASPASKGPDALIWALLALSPLLLLRRRWSSV